MAKMKFSEMVADKNVSHVEEEKANSFFESAPQNEVPKLASIEANKAGQGSIGPLYSSVRERTINPFNKRLTVYVDEGTDQKITKVLTTLRLQSGHKIKDSEIIRQALYDYLEKHRDLWQ